MLLRRHVGIVTHVVRTAVVLIVLLLWAGFMSNGAVQGDIDEVKLDTSVGHHGTPSPPHQTTVLNRLWWRNLEEQDTFIQTLFRKPLATANIGMISGTSGGDGAMLEGQRIVHHAPANSTGPEKRLFIPRLHMVYTITPEQKKSLEVEVASKSTTVTATPAATHTLTKSAGTPYAQLLRSVLPLGFGWFTEDVAKPLTPLQVVALRSPITPLRAYVLPNDEEEAEKSAVRSDNDAAVNSPGENIRTAAAATANEENKELSAIAADGMAAESRPITTTTTANGREILSEPSTQKANAGAAQRAHYLSRNSADETLIVVGSATKAVVPLQITGTSYTIVQFDGKAGNTINAVVQLKDHRYNDSVKPSNCLNMYLKVELRNHVKHDNDEGSESESSATYATTQPHARINQYQWSSHTARTATRLSGGSDHGNGGSSYDPDISTANRSSWENFWDSFALMFDTSALCKVLPSVSMRVNKAPQTEPFYVVLRSATGYAYDTAYYYNTTSGAFYANTMDDDYTCELDLFIEQWPAAEQERLQFIFSFLVPLLVLLLPLPFTMRRADLVQQYMMETDYAEWVWHPPYYLRKKIMEGLKALTDWVVRLHTAYQQHRLQTQLHRQQEQQQQQQQQREVQTRSAPPACSDTCQHSSSNSRSNTNRREDVAPANDTSMPLLPSSSMEALYAVTAGVSTHEDNENVSSPSQRNYISHPREAERPDEKEDEAVHRACPLRAQFKETASAGSSASSDTSHCSRSSTRSISGSDLDEGPDGRRPHRSDSVSGGESDDRSRSVLQLSGVSPPQKLGAPGGLLYAGGPTTVAADASTTTTKPNNGNDATALSLPSSSCGDVHHRRSHRCHHHGHRCHSSHHCRHHGSMKDDGASHAVSVHVPFSMDSPILGNPRGGSSSSGNARATLHDFLFTTPETRDTEALWKQQQSIPQSREENETGYSSDPLLHGAVEGRVVATNYNKDGNSESSAAPRSGHEEGNTEDDSTETVGDAEEPFCRICREGRDVAPLLAPCSCTGSVRFVHAACLDRWRLESAKRNLANVNHCEICKMPFTVHIQRSTLLWESSQHVLRGICLFFSCVVVIVMTTTLTHGILGELSCLAYYHEVTYGTMFRFEGLSLSLFVYGLAVLLVLLANLIVYSWFRSRREVEEYVEEMHVIPPFYSHRNMILIVLVCALLLAQVHATGFLLKYFLYNTSRIVWSWETSPLVGGMLFALFTTCTVTVCSWGRQMYMAHVVNRGNSQNTAGDVMVENAEDANINNGDGDAPTAPANASPATADAFYIPSSTTTNSHTPQPNSNSDENSNNTSAVIQSSVLATLAQYRESGTAPPPPHTSRNVLANSPLPPLRAVGTPQLPDQDVAYTRYFDVPPEQRVIRAFEYCPPHRKVPR